MSQQLQTTLFYLNLAGLCPNSFHNEFISLEKKLFIAFQAVFPSYHFFCLTRDSYSNHQDIEAFLLVLAFLVSWTNFLLNIITPILNPTSIVKFFQIINEAQKTITSLDITQPAEPSKKTQLCYIGIFAVFPMISLILILAPFDSFYGITSNVITVSVNSAALIKVKQMLLLLNSNFKILNNKLKKISDESLSVSSKTGFDVDNFMLKLHNVKYVKSKNNGSVITVDQILKFNQAHFLLCDAHKMLESMFSVTALTGTLYVSFWLVATFTNTDDYDLAKINMYCYSLLIFFLFISVLSSATDVKNNCLKTGYLVHELLNEELPFEVEEELHLFSRSLCLRKIGLSAHGFFMIDLKLLTKMVCTLAPLILIVVQHKHRAMKAIKN